MTDPITGALVAAALTAGAKAIGGEAVKDAYGKLKSAASRLLGSDADKLIANPDSPARAEIVAEEVEKLPAADHAELRALAEAVVSVMKEEGLGTTIDNSITVIATNHGVAAGRDVNIGALPERDKT